MVLLRLRLVKRIWFGYSWDRIAVIYLAVFRYLTGALEWDDPVRFSSKGGEHSKVRRPGGSARAGSIESVHECRRPLLVRLVVYEKPS